MFHLQLVREFPKITNLIRPGDRISCIDELFYPADGSLTNEDETDGWTLQKIYADSKKRQAALTASKKMRILCLQSSKIKGLASSSSNPTYFSTTPSYLA